MISLARRFTLVAAVLLAIFTATGAQAESSGQQRVVERARLVLDAFLDDPNFNDMRVYVQNAYAVLIVPDMLEGGFLLAAQHGVGVLLVRDLQTGAWGQPVFYDLYGGSFGLQFGGQSSDVVFTIMTEGAVGKLLNGDFELKLGAGAGMAVGRVGANVGAGTTTYFGEDIYVFAKSKGLYGGIALDGSVVVPKHEWNEAYYGRRVTPEEVARAQQVAANGNLAALHQTLTQF